MVDLFGLYFHILSVFEWIRGFSFCSPVQDMCGLASQRCEVLACKLVNSTFYWWTNNPKDTCPPEWNIPTHMRKPFLILLRPFVQAGAVHSKAGRRPHYGDPPPDRICPYFPPLWLHHNAHPRDGASISSKRTHTYSCRAVFVASENLAETSGPTVGRCWGPDHRLAKSWTSLVLSSIFSSSLSWESDPVIIAGGQHAP